jgi:hypothetical protein
MLALKAVPMFALDSSYNSLPDIWLKELNIGDSMFDSSIAVATYDAGAKLDWHIHPGGQGLLITQGTGYYQERGKPIQIVSQRRCHKSSWRRALARCITEK